MGFENKRKKKARAENKKKRFQRENKQIRSEESTWWLNL